MKIIKSVFLISIITFILWEITLGIYARVANLPMNLPTYTFENTHSFWYDLDSTVGTFHLANHHYRQKKSCFDVDYYTNSKGFRDKERRIKSTKSRVVTIGDSFVEGYGVDTANRFSNRLEKETSQAHLNFSFAGNFSPTQYFLLYEKFALKYDHEAVIIGILPSNDFIDDDFELIKKQGTNRYKPFLNGSYPEYKIEYFNEQLNESFANVKRKNNIKILLSNFTHSYHLYFYLKAKILANNLTQEVNKEFIPSYFSYRKKHINRLKYCIERIAQTAKSKKVLVVSIPSKQEVLHYMDEGQNPLANELYNICQSLNIEYLDLLQAFAVLDQNTLGKMYLNCDGHWSPNGHKFAADQIKNNFSFYAFAEG